jgi:hypothetical protein
MEGIGYLFLLLGFLLFISLLFTGLLVLHFLKIRPSIPMVIILVVAALVLSMFLISSEFLYTIGFSYLLFYAAAALLGYIFIVGFSGEKPVPKQEEES